MDEAVSLLYAALMVLTSLGSICGNLLLLLVLLLNKELQTDTWGLTLSFSLSDLALGLSTIPFGAHNSLFRPDGYPDDGALCQGSGFLFLLLQLASIHSLTWATIDKFTEICFALSYASICSLRRTRLVLVLVWFYSLLNAALPLLGFGRYSYSKTRFICAPSFEHAHQGFNMLFIVAGIIAPTLIMCSLYGYIVYIARKQVRRGTFVCNDQHCFYVPANTYFRSSIVMVATSVCLLACWLPYICLGFYETISGREGPEAASALATWLVLFTATINPWINSMTQARYRAALKRSLLKLRQALQPQRKISRTQSTAFHLDAATSNTSNRSNTSSVVPPPKDESMTSQTGPGDTRGTSHTHTDRESPVLPPSCYIVEVNEDRDTEGTEERDGTGNSTTQPHGPTGEFPQHVNRDRGSRHSQDCPKHTAEEHSTDPTQTGTVPEP